MLKPAHILAALVVPWTLTAETRDLSRLPPNQWTLLNEESNAGGKTFAKTIYADNTGEVFLWGTGGRKPARNVYERFELEACKPGADSPSWESAFPIGAMWTSQDYPPFRIYGQSGPDGLKYDEGPRLQTVGGYHSVNRIRWWDFDGIRRPSPIHTFNMAAWDSQRDRIIYYSDGQTIALDPKTRTWTDVEAQNHPATCKHLAWASMCYDPGRDRVLLFGGGLATNPSGGAPTWSYDCAANEWKRIEAETEPPLRCNASLVYDAAGGSAILFGGYTQAAGLNDTWIFDCENDNWRRAQATTSPPPMEAPAGVSLGNGKVLVCGNDARKVRRDHHTSTSATKETWIYDLNGNTWTPVDGKLSLPGARWLTATRTATPNVAVLVSFGSKRQTFAIRYDADEPAAELPGAPANSVAWKYPEQKQSLEDAPTPDRTAHARMLAGLPPNTFVDAKPPGLLISKTWSTAVLDTDRSEVIYVGGGHSGYSGNDVARYSIADNRWSLDQPPRFPPFLEGTNAGIYGWSYGMMPFSQHTYLWYAYDPGSEQIIYLARPSIPDGVEVQLEDDPASTFTYSSEKHGYASWLYDSASKRMHRPVFGRPFKNPWHLSLVGTPRGTFAACDNELHLATTSPGEIEWKLIDKAFPNPRGEPIKYHYEFQPLVHDTKRGRLIQLKGDKTRVDVFVRPASPEGTWRQLETTGKAAIGREAAYIPRHDVVLWLGDELFALDCATNRLAEVEVDLPKGSYNHECAMVYDPKHDVCVALIPASFSGPMQTFLFRYEPDNSAPNRVEKP